MQKISFIQSAVRDAIEGPVHIAGEEGYDTARLPWQRAIDPYPALVAEATSAKDVIAAVRAARDHNLPFVVQGTGHGAVRAVDCGLLLRTDSMASVRVDPAWQTARVSGGALWSDVITAAARYGLAPLSGSSPAVGVTGYTLGGGAALLSRGYGYAADSVLSFQVVTADGVLRTASAMENPDLFWALRGGSGNFGVVTALEFRLYPVGPIYGGMSMYGFDRAADLFTRYRTWALDEPAASNTAVIVARMPDSPRPMIAIRAFYEGDAADAEALLAPLREVAGPPLMDGMRSMSYSETSALLGPPPAPQAAVNQLDLFRALPDEAIGVALDAVENELVTAVELRHWGGAMARPAADAGPIGHRDVPFSMLAGAVAPSAAELPDLSGLADRFRPFATGGTFLNFLNDPGRTADAYTAADYQRLRRVKRAYDPDNFFTGNHNIPPAEFLSREPADASRY